MTLRAFFNGVAWPGAARPCLTHDEHAGAAPRRTTQTSKSLSETFTAPVTPFKLIRYGSGVSDMAFTADSTLSAISNH